MVRLEGMLIPSDRAPMMLSLSSLDTEGSSMMDMKIYKCTMNTLMASGSSFVFSNSNQGRSKDGLCMIPARPDANFGSVSWRTGYM
jgi:hypothetical protein